MNSTADYEYAEETHLIIGCAMKVHSTLGTGFQEFIYQRALSIELAKANCEHCLEFEAPIYYEGQAIGSRRVDVLVQNKIAVELKAVEALQDVHIAQAKNYLEAFNLRVGLLINFGSKSLQFKRMLNPRAPV
jgi:GxxExxY protein